MMLDRQLTIDGREEVRDSVPTEPPAPASTEVPLFEFPATMPGQLPLADGDFKPDRVGKA